MGWLVVALLARLGYDPCARPGSRTRKRPALRLVTAASCVLLPAFASGAADQTEDEQLLASDAAPLAEFGSAVSIDGEWAVVGAPEETSGTGAAYVFRFDAGAQTWVEEAKLVASDGEVGDFFGVAVAVYDDDTAVSDDERIVVGADGADTFDDGGAFRSGSGAAYVFRNNGATWLFQQKLVAPDRQENDRFGASVAVDADTIVVGVPLDNTFDPATNADHPGGRLLRDTGTAWVFRESGATWVDEQQLIVITTDLNTTDPEEPFRNEFDYFGGSLAVLGDVILVGTDGDDTPALVASKPLIPNHGAVHVFRYDGTSWLFEQLLLDPRVLSSVNQFRQRAANDRLGHSVTLDLDPMTSLPVAIAGAWADQVDVNQSGSASVFRYDGSVWNWEVKLAATDQEQEAQFGVSVSLSDDYAVVGASREDTAADDGGVVYVFEYDGVDWIEEHRLLASDAGAADEFGFSVSIDGSSVLVGAPNHDERGQDAGAAYVYTVPEPSLLALQAAGLVTLAGLARRSRRRAAR